MRSDDLVCTTCGHAGRAKSDTPGNIAIELVLWLCFLVPGLIYSIWRLSARREVCGACGAATLVPVATPVGRSIVKQHHSEQLAHLNAQPQRRPPSADAYDLGGALGRALGRLLRRR